MQFRRTPYIVVGLALMLCLLLPSAGRATPLGPFLDLQEKGLTLSSAGVGTQGWDGSPRPLTLNIGGPVRFAFLYWGGRQRPCDQSSPGVCTIPPGVYRDQKMIFDGAPITGTITGSEWQPTSGGGPIMNVGYYADVTSIVAAKGTGSQTFTFADGDKSSNLWRLNGAGLLVGWTDTASSLYYRVLIFDGLDFAYGPDPTPGDNRVTQPITFNHGINLVNRNADLYIYTGDGTPDRPENITISNNPTLFNVINGISGFDWDSNVFPITIPAGVGTTTVQVNSAPVNQNPDSLLWIMAALRVQQLDFSRARCPVRFLSGPPAQAIVTLRDPETGLASIVVDVSQNADTPVPPFTVGTTDPVTITATKIDQSQPARVEIKATDLAGNVAICDPIQTLMIRDGGRPEEQTFRSVPQAEGKITINNGTPGLVNLDIFVNNVMFKVKNLGNGASQTLNVSSAMHAGSNNVVSMKATGRPGGWADIIIWDGQQ